METEKERNASEPNALKAANLKTITELLPLIITMAVLGIVGIIGNIVTARFYGLQRRKTPTKFLIMSLAIVDLIVCILFAPNIAEMYLNVLYTSPMACKTMHFLGHWALESSCLILVFIAVDRYTKLCDRFKIRITNESAKKVVITILAFSCILSVRDFVNFDVVSVVVRSSHNNSEFGHYCTITHNPDFKLSILVFHAIDALTVLSASLTILLCYISIIMTLYKTEVIRQGKLSKYDSKHSINVSQTSLNCTVQLATSCTCVHKTNTTNLKPHAPLEKFDYKGTSGIELSGPTEIIEEAATNAHALNDSAMTLRTTGSPNRKKKIRRSERSITFLMVAVSAAFFLCASPYLATRLSLMATGSANDLEHDLLTQFGLRLCYINSVINPIIYCLFNPLFRRQMKGVLMCKRESVLVSNTDVTSGWY